VAIKELHGQATTTVAAPRQQCFVVLRQVDGYPQWYPDTVRELQVVDRDSAGEPTKVRTKLHVAHGPVVKDFDLLMAVSAVEPETVSLTRVTDGRSDQRFDVVWRLSEAGARTGIALDLKAALDVPRFLPLGGIGDSIAQGFVAAASAAIESASAAAG